MFSLKNLMTIFVNKPHSFFIPMQVMAYLFFHEGIQTQNFRYKNELTEEHKVGKVSYDWKEGGIEKQYSSIKRMKLRHSKLINSG